MKNKILRWVYLKFILPEFKHLLLMELEGVLIMTNYPTASSDGLQKEEKFIGGAHQL